MAQDRDNSSLNMSPPRKRRRQPKSCDQCRRRKVRCDREFPCGQCERARTSLQCFYAPTVTAGSPSGGDGSHFTASCVPESHTAPSQAADPQTQSRPHVPISQSPPPVQDQSQNRIIQDLQRRLRRLEKHLPNPPSSRVPTGSNPVVSETEALRHLHGQVLSVEEQLSDAVRPSPSINGWAIPATLPRLRVAPDKTKLFGPSHWLHTAEKVCIGFAYPSLTINLLADQCQIRSSRFLVISTPKK